MICYHRATKHLPSNYTFCKYWVYETENLQKSTVSITDCLQNAYVYQLSGMIVTLYLISANVYNSVDAPKNRGFSYIEIWMFGTQFPILVALLEYGFVLLLKKVIKLSDENETKIFEEKITKLDLATLIFSFFSFMIFASLYWIVALTSQ